MKILFWTAAGFLSLVSPSRAQIQEPLYIVLRIDDIQSRNTTYLPKQISAFELAAEQRGAKVTYVTIPHRILEPGVNNGMLTTELKNSILHGHEIAQHGFNHICTRCGSSGHEMYCDIQKSAVSRSVQDSLIKFGMKVLKDSLGIVPKLFVSPGHHEDSMTYRLLAENHFSNISTTRALRGEVLPGLFNIPSSKEYTWAMTEANYRSQLTAGLNDVRTIGEQNGCFVFLFHDPFTRYGYLNGIVIAWMGEMLDSLTKQYGGRLKLVTLSEASEHFKQTTMVSDHAGGIPEESALESNYPNPFNPSTTITYRVGRGATAPEFVNISVFDLMGRETAVLVHEVQQPGVYSVEFNASHRSSGMYLCRLRTGTAVSVRKLLLVR